MYADEIRQRKNKRRGQKDMINIETLGQRTKFIADDKYKLIEDHETDSEDEEVLQHNGKVSNSRLNLVWWLNIFFSSTIIEFGISCETKMQVR